VSFDARAAWTGTLDGTPAVPFRIEAASWKGRPVYFEVVWPWMRPLRVQVFRPSFSRGFLVLAGFVAVLLIAGVVAWQHYPRPAC
jgi:hypothetical protein